MQYILSTDSVTGLFLGLSCQIKDFFPIQKDFSQLYYCTALIITSEKNINDQVKGIIYDC